MAQTNNEIYDEGNNAPERKPAMSNMVVNTHGPSFSLKSKESDDTRDLPDPVSVPDKAVAEAPPPSALQTLAREVMRQSYIKVRAAMLQAAPAAGGADADAKGAGSAVRLAPSATPRTRAYAAYLTLLLLVSFPMTPPPLASG